MMDLSDFIVDVMEQNYINTATNHSEISKVVQETIYKFLLRQDILSKLERDLKDDPSLKEDIIELIYRVNSREVLIEKNKNC